MSRVLVAMSGGIDSTISAVLLHQQGHEVVGLTMKTWDYASAGGSKKETGCCSLDSINDARAVAVEVGFPHYILDMRDEFGESVIDDFASEYMIGRTPNPCVMCNTHIKWDALLRRADMMNCEFIATGHYAKIQNDGNRYWVSAGDDPKKDQSYVLWGLDQSVLKRTMFPVGGMKKTEVRHLAKELGFLDLSTKKESFEICFIPDNDYRGFLKRRIPDIDKTIGNFVNIHGDIMGRHTGYPFFTVGQRHGLGITSTEPLYVIDIDPTTCNVMLGKSSDLRVSAIHVDGVKFQKSEIFDKCSVKVRYKTEPISCSAKVTGEFSMILTPDDPISGVAPGQSAVLYDGQDVLGGGIISKTEKLFS